MISKRKCAASHIRFVALMTMAVFFGKSGLRERQKQRPSLFVDGFLAPTITKRTPLLFSSLSLSKTAHDDAAVPVIENISIEYCPGCRWMTKAFWMATELLQTSSNSIKEVTVIPSGSGIFVVSAKLPRRDAIEQLWDRKVDGGFPPIDLIAFDERVQSCLDKAAADDDETAGACGSTESPTANSTPNGPHIVIRYCDTSGYLLRAAYYGQELLTTFSDGELGAITLQPIENDGGFSVTLDNDETSMMLLLWDKLDSGNFPQVKKLKQLVRDVVTPRKDLGHSDDNKTTDKKETMDGVGDCIPCNEATDETEEKGVYDDDDDDDDDDDGYLDDDEAEEARRYFGVM